MKKAVIIFTFLLFTFSFSVFAQEHDHEYAPLQEKKITYQDWTYENILTEKKMNLREFTKDKKLVMVFYFAPWCHSSNYQLPVTQKLYEKYKDKGLEIVGVSLYASADRVKNKIKFYGLTFPVVTESLSSKERQKTLHYKYRTETGDNRKWGTPYNVFLIPGELEKEGDTLTTKTTVVNGEIKEEEAEEFIRKQLGL